MGAQNDSSEIMSLGAIILQGVAGVLDTPLKLLNIKSLTFSSQCSLLIPLKTSETVLMFFLMF